MASNWSRYPPVSRGARFREHCATNIDKTNRIIGGATSLMYAAQQGDAEKVRRIVKEQPSLLFDRDRTRKTALHYCTASGHHCAAQAADLMVMAAPDLIDSRDEDGFTPLHLAVISGNMQLVTFLLANNADVNAVDNENHTVVHWATVCGETAALSAVLGAGAPVSSPDIHGGYPLHYAAQMCGGDRDSSLGFQVLQTLLTHSDIQVSVTDDDKRQPLLWAASAGSAKAVLALVRAGATIDGADKDGLMALHCAASRGHTDCLDTLLTLCGASVDVIDSNGCTALHYAVTLGHADATALLLAHGADPNRQDRKGRSPAHCGCAKGQLETIKLIGAHGANLWLRNAKGDLPLHNAASSGRIDLVKWLLQIRPSQVNAKNNDGRCPLHLAALNDNVDMCKVLLDAGAQINPILRTSKNILMTPLDCALQKNFRSTAKFLQLHGGVPAVRVSGSRTQVSNMQIKDDATFWGNTTSESERENEIIEKIERKVNRKKRSQRHEKKRPSLSSVEKEAYSKNEVVEEKMQKVTQEKETIIASQENKESPNRTNPKKNSPSSVLDYSNEIVINGKTEITIHQTKEIHLDEEHAPVIEVREEIRQIAVDREKRPKSAKYSKLKNSGVITSLDYKDALTREEISIDLDTNLDSFKKESLLKDKSTNTSDETIVTVIENKIPSSEQQAPVKIDSFTEPFVDLSETQTPDQQSILSVTSQDVQKQELVVEASIHPPPRPVAEAEEMVGDDLNQCRDDVKMISEDKEDCIAKLAEIDTPESHREEIETEKIIEKPLKVKEKQDDNLKPDISGPDNKSDKTLKETEEHPDAKEEISVESTTSNAKEHDQPSETLQNNLVTEHVGEDKTQELLEINEAFIEPNEVKEFAHSKIDNIEEDIDKMNIDKSHGSRAIREINVQQIEKDDTEISEISSDGKTQYDEKPHKVNVEKNKLENRFIKQREQAVSENLIPINENSHKSFRILNEQEAEEFKKNTQKRSRKRTAQKKLRSHSDEVKIREPKQKRKPSKIPTPLYNNKLSKSDKYLYKSQADNKLGKVLDARIPSLPNIRDDKCFIREPTRCESNMSAPPLTSLYSDNERDSFTDPEDSNRNVTKSKRFVKRRSRNREARSAGSDYESSNLIDSGFEPSPRTSKIPRWKNMSERGVNMTSVTQNIQSNIRRYHLERKIFHQLLELKRLQIRAGQHNEAILVKRAIDDYHRSCASTVGAGKYIAQDFTFKSFEKFLYEALRKLQKNDPDYMKGLPVSIANPLLCTKSTNRCMHATHAYTGVPCAAYLPKMDHHTIPKIGFSNVECKPGSGFLPTINSKKAVTLELSHGTDKQIISLPTDRLDQNKRYYVTFTVKEHENSTHTDDSNNKTESRTSHRHARSD